MEANTPKSPVDVANEVQQDLTKRMGMTLADAARKIGKTPQNFYNMLTGRSRFSRKTAQLMYEQFGYSVLFLTKGLGALYETEEKHGSGFIVKPNSAYPILVNKTFSVEEMTSRERRMNAIKNFLSQEYQRFVYAFEDDEGISSELFSQVLKDLRFSPEDFGFKCETQTEKELFPIIAFWYGLIMKLADPSRLSEVLGEKKVDTVSLIL